MEDKDPARYEIRVRCVLSEATLGAFPTLTGRSQDGITALRGPLPNQSVRHGALQQIKSLGHELLAVLRLS